MKKQKKAAVTPVRPIDPRTYKFGPFRFPNVYCSQCGAEFGPYDHGFSHCDNHKGFRRSSF